MRLSQKLTKLIMILLLKEKFQEHCINNCLKAKESKKYGKKIVGENQGGIKHYIKRKTAENQRYFSY